MVQESKGLLQSKSVIGNIVAIAPVIDQALVLTGVLPFPLFGDVLGILVSAVGNLLGIWGRVKAQKPIKGIL